MIDQFDTRQIELKQRREALGYTQRELEEQHGR